MISSSHGRNNLNVYIGFAIFLHHSFLKISCRVDKKTKASLKTVEDSSFFLDLLHDWKALSV